MTGHMRSGYILQRVKLILRFDWAIEHTIYAKIAKTPL